MEASKYRLNKKKSPQFKVKRANLYNKISIFPKRPYSRY